MKKLVILVLSLSVGFSSISYAKTVEKTTCFIFKNNQFKEKKPCMITDWQTLGDAYTNDFFIKGYGKFESYGGLDHDTMEEYHMLGKQSAVEQTRLRSNYKIIKGIDYTNFNDKLHLSCVKQTKSGFEICN